MEARFDGWMIRLLHGVRAIAGLHVSPRSVGCAVKGGFRGELFEILYSQGTRGRGGFASKPGGLSWVPPTARPAQGHYSGNAKRFLRPQVM